MTRLYLAVAHLEAIASVAEDYRGKSGAFGGLFVAMNLVGASRAGALLTGDLMLTYNVIALHLLGLYRLLHWITWWVRAFK